MSSYITGVVQSKFNQCLDSTFNTLTSFRAGAAKLVGGAACMAISALEPVSRYLFVPQAPKQLKQTNTIITQLAPLLNNPSSDPALLRSSINELATLVGRLNDSVPMVNAESTTLNQFSCALTLYQHTPSVVNLAEVQRQFGAASKVIIKLASTYDHSLASTIHDLAFGYVKQKADPSSNNMVRSMNNAIQFFTTYVVGSKNKNAVLALIAPMLKDFVNDLKNMQSSNHIALKKIASGIIADIEEGQNQNNWDRFVNNLPIHLAALQEIPFDEIKSIPFAIHGFPIPGTGETPSSDENLNPSVVFGNALNQLEKPEAQKLKEEISKLDPVGKAKIKKQFDTTVSRYSTIRFISEKVCFLKLTEKDYKEILAAGQIPNGEPLSAKKQSEAIQKAFFKKLDSEKSISIFTLWLAKFLYIVVSPFVHFFMTSVTKKIKTEVDIYLSNEKTNNFKKLLHQIINGLTEHFEKVNSSYQSMPTLPPEKQAGSSSATLAHLLAQPGAHNNNMTNKQLYDKVGTKAAIRFSPQITWTSTIKSKLCAKNPEKNPVGDFFLRSIALILCAFVILPELIINGCTRLGFKIFVTKNNIINNLIENAATSVKDNNDYKYAFYSVLIEQLKNTRQKLNEKSLNVEILKQIKQNLSESDKLLLSKLIKSLFTTLNFDNLTTQKELKEYVEGKHGTIKKFEEVKDSLFLEEIIENTILIILLAHKTLMTGDELDKLYYTFIKLCNDSMSSIKDIKPEDFVQKEKEVTYWINEILNKTINKAVDNKIDPFKNQAKEILEQFIHGIDGDDSTSLIKLIHSSTGHILATIPDSNESPQEKLRKIAQLRKHSIRFITDVNVIGKKIEGQEGIGSQTIASFNKTLASVASIFDQSIAPSLNQLEEIQNRYVTNPNTARETEKEKKLIETIRNSANQLLDVTKLIEKIQLPVNITLGSDTIKKVVQANIKQSAKKKIDQILRLVTEKADLHLRYILHKVALEPFIAAK